MLRESATSAKPHLQAPKPINDKKLQARVQSNHTESLGWSAEHQGFDHASRMAFKLSLIST